MTKVMHPITHTTSGMVVSSIIEVSGDDDTEVSYKGADE
jgi:hypothetical protein